jgi:HlyD family secretion protein
MRQLPIIAAVAMVGAVAGYALWSQSQPAAVPAGLAQANGRIEVERVDIATKAAGRVAEIRVREGDFVDKDAVVARMDVADLLAQLASAKASVRRAEQGIGKAKADLGSRDAELKLHEVVLSRALQLSRGVLSQAEIDKRTAERDVAKAAVAGARASIGDAEAAKDAAEAQVNQVQVNIDDMTLTAPVAGRVEYRLVQPGEIVAAGGRVATLLDVSDVFMTVFLATSEAGRVSLGSEARIILDAAPQYVVPAKVSFVAGEAQFTPKYVETRNEREKLMYRVKLKIDPKLLDTYREYVKAGLTGTAYVRVAADAGFPDALQPRLPEPPKVSDVR